MFFVGIGTYKGRSAKETFRGSVALSTLMALSTMETGKRIASTARGNLLSLMVAQSTTATGTTITSTEKASSFRRVHILSREFGTGWGRG